MSILNTLDDIFKERNLDTLLLKDIPRPHTMRGIEEMSNIIKEAILSNKKIAIIGDYDVDGITSVCIVERFFNDIGYTNFTTKIPNRFIDGYGINERFIDEIDADIFLTVDNGISAFGVADYCKQKNKILLITDHHKPLIVGDSEKLPNALVVNPNQKACNFLQKDVCGAMVAWYLCAGIKQAMNLNINLTPFTSFVALAIISDIMPLTSLNRTIFKCGINKMKDSTIAAFKILQSRFCINSSNIAFSITPILNSAGRIKDASIALDFFRENDVYKANAIFEELIQINNERKRIQQEVLNNARNNIKRKYILVAFGNDWNEGVLGIVAARLCEESNISAFCFNAKNGILKGSGRARGGVNLIATIQKCQEKNENLLLGFGGHTSAVGVSLEEKNLDLFMEAFDDNVIILNEKQPDSALCVDFSEINIELLELLESYEPYGCGNPPITFYANDVYCKESQQIGKAKEHQILTLSQGKHCLKALLFNDSSDYANKHIDIVFSLQRDKMDAQILQIREISNIRFYNKRY